MTRNAMTTKGKRTLNMGNHKIKQALYRTFSVVLGLSFSQACFCTPNILLILTDDLNTRISTYGDPIAKTPNIDRLAKVGIRFDRAYANYPQCMASRASFLTGLYPEQNGVSRLHHKLRDKVPKVATLPQILKENGYHTAAVGKIFHFNVPSGIGSPYYDVDPISWSESHNPAGIDRTSAEEIKYLGPHINEKSKDSNMNGGWLSTLRLGGSRNDYTDGKITNLASKILTNMSKNQDDKPFFLAVGYVRPHVPFSAPEHFFDLYPTTKIFTESVPKNDREDIPLPQLSDRPYQLEMTEYLKKEMMQAYYASISFIDDEIGRLIQKLDDLDLRESTLILFTSDHGYLLGEHDLWQKPNLFEQTLRVPLVIASRHVKRPGVATKTMVELIDIYPTILSLAGVNIPEHNAGKSFAELLEQPNKLIRPSALSMSHSQASSSIRPGVLLKNTMGYTIKTKHFRYTEWDGGIHGAELYDHRSDPKEITNLYSTTKYASERSRLGQMLQERILESREPREYLHDN
tara:strand:- start:121 stop:1674 length:1554 start_codon:yes stop_codon:yes gene_type:complete